VLKAVLGEVNSVVILEFAHDPPKIGMSWGDIKRAVLIIRDET